MSDRNERVKLASVRKTHGKIMIFVVAEVDIVSRN